MSPKFALSLLLLCFVLIGLSDAQGRQQSNHRTQGTKYRIAGTDGSFSTDSNPPALDAPNDCNQNSLANNSPDRFSKRKG